MLDWLINLDKDLLLEINGTHAPLLDHIMVFVSAKWSGIPIYAAILYMIFHKRSPKTAIVMVCAILLTFALTDYLSVHLIKNNICRFRPGWDPTLESIVRLLENKGGKIWLCINPCGKLLWPGLYIIKTAEKELVHLIHIRMVNSSRLQQGVCSQTLSGRCNMRRSIRPAHGIPCISSVQIHS